MKVIILAAGMGKRLGRYCSARPKCMLELGGITLLERQVATFRRVGLSDIVVVTGYLSKEIKLNGVRYYQNPAYVETNMVHSLFCALPEIDGELIISYGDIVFDESVLRHLLSARDRDIVLVVDSKWEGYYRERFEDPLDDAESLVLGEDGRVLEIGERNPDPRRVEAQYIGLLRLSDEGSRQFLSKYERTRLEYAKRTWIRGRVFEPTYMTDFLQGLIADGIPVHTVGIEHGWLEFDTPKDYELVLDWYAKGILDKYCRLER